MRMIMASTLYGYHKGYLAQRALMAVWEGKVLYDHETGYISEVCWSHATPRKGIIDSICDIKLTFEAISHLPNLDSLRLVRE